MVIEKKHGIRKEQAKYAAHAQRRRLHYMGTLFLQWSARSSRIKTSRCEDNFRLRRGGGEVGTRNFSPLGVFFVPLEKSLGGDCILAHPLRSHVRDNQCFFGGTDQNNTTTVRIIL